MTKRPKIIQVTILADEGQGGIHTAVEHFAAALRPWSEHAILDFSEKVGPVAGERVRLRIASGFLGRKFGWISAAERAKGERVLAGADFVLIHVPYRFHAGWAAAWCRKHGVPYSFVPHGAFDPYVFTYRAWQKKLWLRTVGKRLFAGASFVLYATLGEAEKGERATGPYSRQVLPWPNPVPAEVDRAGSNRRVRERFSISESARILLFLGRLHPMKRPRETVEAFLATQPRDWHLIVAGPADGVTIEELKELGGAVHVCGPVFGREKTELLSGVDALVLFSHRENFGFVVTEALAHGIPVVVSRELDLAPELIAKGCGWVVDGSTDAGRRAALTALPDLSDEERALRGARGREWVREEMSEQRFQLRLREMIERVIAGTKSTHPG